ncbi:Ubiquitin-conjugating enzyme E2 T [Actinomortierella ambigua]|nr:Ubiquitin-conjugating enzyme E2 T [Actinomortierella ambigua]
MASSGRMVRLAKDLNITKSKGQICHPVNDSLDHLNAGMSREGYLTTVATNTYYLAYPIDPPKCEFLTRVYHPNIDDQGRICLSVLKTKPLGDWTPAQNVSTILDSIVLLLGSPSPDDPLEIDIANEYKASRELFILKAKDFTKRYATKEKDQNTSSICDTTAVTRQQNITSDQEPPPDSLETPAQDDSMPSSQQHQRQLVKPGELDKKRLKLSRPSMKRASGGSLSSSLTSATISSSHDNHHPIAPVMAPTISTGSDLNVERTTHAIGTQHDDSHSKAIDHHHGNNNDNNDNNNNNNKATTHLGRPMELDTVVRSSPQQDDTTCERHVAYLPPPHAAVDTDLPQASTGWKEETGRDNDDKNDHCEKLPATAAPPPCPPIKKSKHAALRLGRKRTWSDTEGSMPRQEGAEKSGSDEMGKTMENEENEEAPPSQRMSFPSRSGHDETKDRSKTIMAVSLATSMEALVSLPPSQQSSRVLAERPVDMILNLNSGSPPTRRLGHEGHHDRDEDQLLAKEVDKRKKTRRRKMSIDPLPLEAMPRSSSSLVDTYSPETSTTLDWDSVPCRPLAEGDGMEDARRAVAAAATVIELSEDEGDSCQLQVTTKETKVKVTEMDNASGRQEEVCSMTTMPRRTASPEVESDRLPLVRLLESTSNITSGSSSPSTPSLARPSLASSSSNNSDSSGMSRMSPTTYSDWASAATKSPSLFLATRSTEEIVQVARKRDLMKKKHRAVRLN